MNPFSHFGRPSGPTAGIRRRAPARALGLALAVVLLASLLAPLAPTIEAADDSVATEEATTAARDDGAGEGPDQRGEGDGGDEGEGGAVEETPIAEETPVTEETPVVVETPDTGLTADLESPGTSRIDAMVLECASDYGGDFQQLRANCRYSVIPVELYSGGARQEIAQGHVDVRSLPAGEYAIRASLLPGYGQPLTFCGSTAADAQRPLLLPVPASVLDDGSIYLEFPLAADQIVWCEWYTVRTANVGAYMVPHLCPADVDPAGASLSGFAACTGDEDGATVIVAHSDHVIRQVETSDRESGVGWQDLPGGVLTFVVEVQDGYFDAVVFCNLFGADGTATGYRRVNTVNNDGAFFSIEATLLPGEYFSCDWFQIAEPTRLTIYKYVCPPDPAFNYYAAKEDEIGSRCTPYQANEATFDLSGQAGGEPQTKSTTSGGGSAYGVYFDEAPAGPVTVTEHPWRGYGQPLVYCGVATEEGVEFIDVKVDGWRADFEIPAQRTVLCFWYNVPAYDVDVYVTKHACPVDFDGDYADLAALYEACPGLAGVGFVVSDKDGNEVANGQTTGDLGELAFEDLPPGDLSIVEPFRDDFGRPIVFCRLTDATGRATDDEPQLVVSGNVGYGIEKRLHGGEILACEWFNLPDHGEVWITKYFCPEDDEFNYYAVDDETLRSRCEPYKGSEIGFDFVSHAAGTTTARYGDPTFEGSIWWDKAPVGPMTITEHTQEGYGRPVVFCGYAVGSSFYPFPVEVDGWSIDVEVVSTKTEKLIACAWFNIPEQTGSVTVVKHACPDGTGYDEGWYDWYEERCPALVEGVTFKLDGVSSGNPGDRPTDADGVVSWDEREADRYYLYEGLPAGYGAPVVYCSAYYPLDEQPPAWEEYDPEYTPDADPFAYRIAFDLAPGQHVVCVWFNVPDVHGETGKVTVVKYWCDGGHVAELNCALYGGGQEFVLRPVGGGEAIELTTGQNGKKTVRVPAGNWELEEVGREWCKAESADVTADGYLRVRAGRETVVTVYNCGDRDPDDPPATPLPTKLPNTGSGDAVVTPALARVSGAGSPGYLIAGGSLVGLAGLTARSARRSWRAKWPAGSMAGAADAARVDLATGRFDLDRTRWSAEDWLGR